MLKFAVDWFAATIKESDHEKSMPECLFPDGTNEYREAKAHNGYTNALENRCGASVWWNVHRADMGVHVDYSGTTLSAYRTKGIEPMEIVRHHVTRGHKVTRIDVAIDAIDTEISPRKLYRQLETGKAHTKGGRGYDARAKSDGGFTLYIGARTSNVFLRIYDKGKEMHTDDVWVRVELEIKGSKARVFANMIANGENGAAIEKMRGVLKSVVDFEDDTWKQITGSEPIKLTDGTRKVSDTKAWLLELVAPAMGKYLAKSNDAAIIEQFMETVEHWRKLSDTWGS